MTSSRERLHRLVDELPERDEVTATAERMLAELRDYGDDPLARMLLSAPIDDEPDSEIERADAAVAREQMIGRPGAHESIRDELSRREE